MRQYKLPEPMKIVALIFFVGLLLFLSFNRHSKSGRFNYHSEIWADKAGYYMYLPAVLKYHFNAREFPSKIDDLTGHGFRLDTVTGKVFTKYTYGVALLQLPFFLLADIAAKSAGYNSDGFAPIYHWAVNISAVSYLIIALLLLGKALRNTYSSKTVLITLFSLLFGTNLFYYGLDETGMSHIYSFFLFSALLSLLVRERHFKLIEIALIGFVVGLILIIRPTNIIFVTFSAFIFFSAPKLRAKFHLRSREWILGLLSFTLALLPQLLYWRYSSGNLFTYSYGSESFHWNSPHILLVLFAPNNGWITYTPLTVILLWAAITYYNVSKKYSIALLTMTAILLYVISCWWMPSYGCSFGARNMVEYYVVFIFPFANLIEKTQRHRVAEVLSLCLILFFILINLKLTYSYDGCYHGKGDWDWGEYRKYLSGATK